MNKLLNDLAPATGIALLALLACAAPVRASDSPIDALNLRMQHEAELASGEKLLVAYHVHKVSTFRFCIPEQPGNIRLKVLHDGEATEVLDGTCETVSGRHIDVVADSKLPQGELLQLKFHKASAA
jgi:hypothetical protein